MKENYVSNKYPVSFMFSIMLQILGLIFFLIYAEWSHIVIVSGLLILQIKYLEVLSRKRYFFILFPLTVMLYVIGSHNLFRLYETLSWYDKLVHILTEFSLTLLAGRLLMDKYLPELGKKRLLALVLIISVGIAIGAVWEIVEYFLTFISPPTFAYTAEDTATDLIIDSLGAFLAGLVIYGKISKVKVK